MNFLSLFIQVSATFAASLITSPALGAYLGTVYGDSVVIALATAISLLDFLVHFGLCSRIITRAFASSILG